MILLSDDGTVSVDDDDSNCDGDGFTSCGSFLTFPNNLNADRPTNLFSGFDDPPADDEVADDDDDPTAPGVVEDAAPTPDDETRGLLLNVMWG